MTDNKRKHGSSKSGLKGRTYGAHKWHMTHPPPGSSTFVQERFKEMKLAFELSDEDHDGYLTKAQAADWFRIVGFCMTTSAIDNLILSRIVTNHNFNKFNFREILQAADKSQKLHGFDLDTVNDALNALSTPKASASYSPTLPSGRVARSRLREALTTFGEEPLTEEEFDLLMKILGVGESDFPSNHLDQRRLSEQIVGILDGSTKVDNESLEGHDILR
ncbi:hypothetical protein FOL47_007391 [Perkinsus chesapeaki]|uniref:EF-hand domain-containing protein n=1 Tax=Perkinsus chesapeaki TaxID=330153 RepID=A0A7J6LKU3_PERCH|nr:hypothetical protein FOL47_007391 [Perkinsus chesapeaki]